MMNRDEMLARIEGAAELWDLIVIGGGATGLGIAVDAAARGYRTLLLEQGDFAQGSSSRSTKLVHGGVRYLQQGNLALVVEALKEREILRRNAPHLVHNLPLVVPIYDWWEGPFYGIGLKFYDLLAGKHGFGPSRLLSREKTQQLIPTIEPGGLVGGVIYHDGQFDDARLAVNLAQTAASLGAVLLNYLCVTGFRKQHGLIDTVLARDVETGREYELRGRVAINATGPFADAVRHLDEPEAAALLSPSQGIHIVLDKAFLPRESAILVPHTSDGRVLFAVPWHDRVIVGTTDTPVPHALLEPRPFPEEIDFLLTHAARYLTGDPTPRDVLSVFAGLRPLVGQPGERCTAALSRDHAVFVSRSGLITITGGKWTTYRRMAQDAVDHAALIAHLPEKPCRTASLPIHGSDPHAEVHGTLAVYGADAPRIEDLLNRDPRYAMALDSALPVRAGQVVWAVRHEMARTVEDVLARRTRVLQLDAALAVAMAPQVARLMGEELGRDETWQQTQISRFTALAKSYLPP
jgi:glycerol-3-phosphate dehydrogenase